MRLNKGVYYKRIVKSSLIKEKNVFLVMMVLEGHFFKLQEENFIEPRTYIVWEKCMITYKGDKRHEKQRNTTCTRANTSTR